MYPESEDERKIDNSGIEQPSLPPLPDPNPPSVSANPSPWPDSPPLSTYNADLAEWNTPESANLSGNAEAEEEDEAELTGWEIAKAVIREIVETVVLTLIIFFLIQSVIRNFRVDGHSMDPNLQHGQYLVVDKISYHLPGGWRPPERGDVVVFEPPTQPDKDFVKRIIGLPGETVEIQGGQVFINNEPLGEVYVPRFDRFSMAPRMVSEGHYFVMGDNRGNSNDSRNWGDLAADKIVGRAWLSYWPPDSWGVIPNDKPTSEATLSHTLSNWLGQAQAAEQPTTK